MDSTTPSPDRFAASSRRTVLAGAAWAVPAITLASATPAFAASGSCVRGTADRVSWSVTNGALDNTTKVSTGWLVRGQYGQPQMISASEAQWFNGTQSGSGTSNQPDGSFISFANNTRTTSTTVLVTYAFQVSGNASVTVNGTVGLGYGNSGTNPQRTERQVVDIAVRQAGGATTGIAKIAHRRRAGTTSTYYPATSNSTTYGAMLRSDPTLSTAGYSLYTATEGEHTYTAAYGNASPIQFIGTGTRLIYVDYVLTLDRYNSTAGLVNDDIIINPPTFAVNCS